MTELSYYSIFHKSYLYLNQSIKDLRTGYIGQISKILNDNNGLTITVFNKKHPNIMYRNDDIKHLELVKNA